jgi:hypothetical protein
VDGCQKTYEEEEWIVQMTIEGYKYPEWGRFDLQMMLPWLVGAFA